MAVAAVVAAPPGRLDPPTPSCSGTLPLSWKTCLCTGSDANVKILEAVQEIKTTMEHMDNKLQHADIKL